MISVIGAGPAGSFYAANASSKSGEEVHIFEEHKKVGKPISCTGIVTSSIKDIIQIPKEAIASSIKEFRIISPNNKSAYVKLKTPDLVLHRDVFDEYLCELAVDKGAKLHLGEKFIGLKKNLSGINNCEKSKRNNNNYIIQTSKKKYDCSMIVGADGPKSAVAKAAGIYGNRKFAYGLQVKCRMKGLEDGVTTVKLGEGEFSWVVKEDDKFARIGIVGRDMNAIKPIFNKIYKENKKNIIESQSGLIPIYDPKLKIRNEGVYLLGDAASQVKATTYGGIIYGLKAAQILSRNKEDYESEINSQMGKELWLSLKIRDMMNSMTPNQYDSLVDIFSKPKNNSIISSMDRNYPTKFLFKLIAQEPRLACLGLGVVKNYLFNQKAL